MSQRNCCQVTVVHRAGSTIQRIGRFRDAQCRRASVTQLFGHHLCSRHARLFAEGHVHPVMLEMTHPNALADIRRSWRQVVRGAQRCLGIRPFYESEVRELVGDERQRWELALGRPLEVWETQSMERGLALSEVIERGK